VTLSPFRTSRFPVTNLQYQRFAEESGKAAPRHWVEGRIPEGKEHHPVVYVSWKDAEAYCSWLSRRIQATSGGVVQLPTEAQWEFAARGEEGRRYPWGGDEPTPEHANFGRNVGDTTPVGSYPRGATPAGIHDLAGNVWEWCRDWYGPYVESSAKDPTGPAKGLKRVLRGGSFIIDPLILRGASRNDALPEFDFDHVGFRVVCALAAGRE
jgi:formylglycine-generating enzyme required for sulfatase activity